jgi:type II secretory pathway component GspD/PulD (secretin)
MLSMKNNITKFWSKTLNKGVFICLLLVGFLCINTSLSFAQFEDLEPSIESELTKDILNSKKPKPVSKIKTKTIPKEELITFSARNISIKDAFATLARISGKSISVGSDIKDDETISVIEIQDQPFEEAFFSLVDASMVNYTTTGNSFTVIKSGSANPIMVFGIGASTVDKSLPLLERTADISYDNQDLGTLLKDLANKYGIDIVLTVAPTERVSVRVRNVTIEQALKLVLTGTSFDYTNTGDNDETFIIYNRLNKNYTLGQFSKMYTLMNLEAMDVQALLPVEVRSNVRISNDQNAIIADGSVNDLKRIEDFLKEIDKPLPQVELELKLIEVRKSAMVEFMIFNSNGFAVGVLGTPLNNQIFGGKPAGSIGGSTTTSSGSTATSSGATMTLINSAARLAFQAATGGDGTMSGILMAAESLESKLDVTKRAGLSIDLSMDSWQVFNNQITYLETHGLAQVRAYPKLVSLSGRTAMINIDQDTNLVLGSASGQAGSIAVATQQLQRITAGTALSITPIVGTGGLITAKIQIEVSDNSNTTTQNGVTIPTTTTRRRINADVQVRDGETVAIGGLVVDNKSIDRQGLPFLTRFNFLGGLTSNRVRQSTKSELIVLITPTIRNIPEEQPVADITVPEEKDKKEENLSSVSIGE